MLRINAVPVYDKNVTLATTNEENDKCWRNVMKTQQIQKNESKSHFKK